MKKIFFFISIILLFSFTTEKNTKKKFNINSIKKIKQSSFQKILDSANVKGSILIFDLQKNTLYSNDFERCSQGFIPASTFKIPNSIIALELGIAKNDSSLFKWNGEKRRLTIWEQDLIFRDAFQYSCVPCYQEIARKIGVKHMQMYLNKLQFGNMKVDSSNIDKFWLEGDSRITTYEQLDFIYRFYTKKLPVKNHSYEIMKKLLYFETTEEGIFSGKTGWVIRNNNNIGWFTGFLEKNDKVLFVVTNIEPEKQFDMDMFPMIRKEISMKALKLIAGN